MNVEDSCCILDVNSAELRPRGPWNTGSLEGEKLGALSVLLRTLLDIAMRVLTNVVNLVLRPAYKAADPSETDFFLQDFVLFIKHQLLFYIFTAPKLRDHITGAPRVIPKP